jgi:hypothetical protein
MLGDVIAEGQGKRTARRVVSVSPSFDVEVSFEDNVTILGVQGQQIVTYHSGQKPDGSLYGEGCGVIATADGEIVTWTGAGTGAFGTAGAVSYRGSIHMSTTSAKLAKLNKVAGVFEFEVDASGNTKSKIWEWK